MWYAQKVQSFSLRREGLVGEDKRRGDDTRRVIENIGEGAKSTVVLQGKILKKIYNATFGAVGRRFAQATVTGKIFILVGLLAAMGLSFLIAREAIQVEVSRSDRVRVMTGRAAIRAAPEPGAAIITRARAGSRLVFVGQADEWWSVKPEGLETAGWIAKHQAELSKRVHVVIDYQMKGYGLALLGALLLVCVGFWLRRRA